jgi:hypothetical protein
VKAVAADGQTFGADTGFDPIQVGRRNVQRSRRHGGQAWLAQDRRKNDRFDRHRPDGQVQFGRTNGRHLLFSDDTSGEENHRIWAITRDTANACMLTPEHGDAARRRAISPGRPDAIVAGLNDRDAAWHDAWTIDLASGRRDRVFENRGGTASECSTMPCRSVYCDAGTRNRAVHRSPVTMPA